MKVLIISSVFPDTIANMYDEAYMNHKLGNDVVIFDCDDSVGYCWNNSKGNRMRCKLCKRYREKLSKSLPSGIKRIYASQYKGIDSESVNFEYSSIKDIKRISYKGVSIGYCCLSIYFSYTRNNNPLIDAEFKEYFDRLLNVTIKFVDIIDKVIQQEKPDRIYVFNGRCTNSRPAIELAASKGIEYICSEVISVFQGRTLRRYFYNSMPHNIIRNTEMIESTWNNQLVPLNDKISLGKRFYESKMQNQYCGDVNYASSQRKGELPKFWDSAKHNVVIFNSSEDEFAAIGEEYESKCLFKSQLEAIKYIVDYYKDYENVEVYLKIHPNLRDIKYKYHQSLYELDGLSDNFHVIPASSTVSTYQMMHDADKIIVFNSTSGPEAAYQKKPVIVLNGALYYYLDFCYIPESLEELNTYLDDMQLQTKYNDNVLKFGYYFMNYHLPSSTKFDIEKTKISIFGQKTSLYIYKKLFGFKIIGCFAEKIIEYFWDISHKSIPIPIKEE